MEQAVEFGLNKQNKASEAIQAAKKIDLNIKIKNLVHHVTVLKVKLQPTKHEKYLQSIY